MPVHRLAGHRSIPIIFIGINHGVVCPHYVNKASNLPAPIVLPFQRGCTPLQKFWDHPNRHCDTIEC